MEGEVMLSTAQPTSGQALVPGAAAQVLDLPELLETVLLNLDITTLFSLQRVNKRFLDVIAASKPLQRKMFLINEPSSKLNDEDNVNPLIGLGRTVFKDDYILMRDSDWVNPFSGRSGLIDLMILIEPNILHRSSYESWRKTRLLAEECTMQAGRLLVWCSTVGRFKYFTLETKDDLKLGQLADYCYLEEQEPPNKINCGHDTKDQVSSRLLQSGWKRL
ncbi:hypothetical protein LTR37_018700 [Vermiconidia calcicola]|uniref:Uncharacterized protein n=1 Tax=Vermiconidia calcicola TaxID=1690605 RepID=A0ACC3MGI5_9PEZI|nr:hypothetical protein LTR37_018700 [Vermiconidia calcicola]